MQIFSVLASVLTVVSFVLFVLIVGWAYGKGRKQAFERAALEPFALPDESEASQAGEVGR
jgi:cbb3-type cytochrome oxidase subunit 3